LSFLPADTMQSVTWVLESDVFPESHAAVRDAIRDRGHRLIDWSDDWWYDGVPSRIPTSAVLFHGSLGNAARISKELKWTPGSFCPVDAFICSRWYEPARQWLVHAEWVICPAKELVANAADIAKQLRAERSLFVRPNSPLKPFSGRVVEIASLTLAKLDHGFYYDDESLPVVVAPVRKIGREWRFVIAEMEVVAGSAYDPATRKALPVALHVEAASFASAVASQIPSPAIVYVLDVCECGGEFRLLELNPFGGADLYACDPFAIVDRVSALAAGSC
jgi:hypothetical protein